MLRNARNHKQLDRKNKDYMDYLALEIKLNAAQEKANLEIARSKAWGCRT